MAKAIADPDEIRRFASELKRFTGNLQSETVRIHRRFKRLSDTWRDQEYAKFAEEFEKMEHALKQFSEASEEQIPLLLRKAEALQNYLDQR